MKSTVVVCSYNRAIQEETRALLGDMAKAGAAYVAQAGVSDVTLARNIALTRACSYMRQLNDGIAELVAEGKKARLPFDTFLMVDDDMTFTLDQAQELINYTRKNAAPASAIYCSAQASLAAMPVTEKRPGEPQLWLAGLGLMAIPAWMLFKLEAASDEFELTTGTYRAFTSSSARGGKWFSEDFELCTRLGGVHLPPIAVGHLKTLSIRADEATVQAIRDGVPLPHKLSEADVDAEESANGSLVSPRNAEGGRG